MTLVTLNPRPRRKGSDGFLCGTSERAQLVSPLGKTTVGRSGGRPTDAVVERVLVAGGADVHGDRADPLAGEDLDRVEGDAAAVTGRGVGPADVALEADLEDEARWAGGGL